MKTIQLTQGQVALVDDEDYKRLSQHKWFASWYPSIKSYYAVRKSQKINGKQYSILMHREILGLQKGDKWQADHINHDTLDNRRCNLRICTNQQNHMNQRKYRTHAGKKCSSGYNGVYWHKNAKKWQAQIRFNGKRTHLGLFTSEIEAAKAYDVAAKKYFGDFANLNFRKEKYKDKPVIVNVNAYVKK